MSPMTGVCVLLTAVFLAISMILVRHQIKPKTNPDVDASTCHEIALYNPNIRKRYIWSYICIGLTILFAILTLLTAFQGKKSKESQAMALPTVSPISTPSTPEFPEFKQTTEPCETTSSNGSSEQDVRLDEIAPLYDIPGNFYFNNWSDGTPFNIDNTPYPSGIGMCITGTDNEKMVDGPEAPLGVPRRDCLEVSILFPLREKYESLVFTIGADKSDLTLFGPSETNGVARVTISDEENGEILFDSTWVDYTYAGHDLTIDISDVDILQITFRSCGEGDKRIWKSLRFVIANPSLAPLMKN